jgi:hypothetical protein
MRYTCKLGAPVLEPGLVVKVVSPADDLALFIDVEHPHAGQLNAPALAVEVPAVKPLGAESVAPAEYVRQFPLDLVGEVQYTLMILRTFDSPTTGSSG